MDRKALDDSFLYFWTTQAWRKKYATTDLFKDTYPKRSINTIKARSKRKRGLPEAPKVIYYNSKQISPKKMKHIQSAGVVIYSLRVSKKIEYLVLQYAAGHWEFPKGKVEPGETIVQAAQRELLEETGLVAQLDSEFSTKIKYNFINYDGEPVHKTVTFLLGSVQIKKVVLSNEHKNFVWLSYKQALQKVTFQNAGTVLRQAHAYLQLL